MDVETALDRRTSITGKEIVIHGNLQAAYIRSAGRFYGQAWMVQDTTVKLSSGNAILIVRPGLVNLLEDAFGHRYGRLPHSYRARLTGTLTDSADAGFLVALTEIGKCKIEGRDKSVHFDFLKDRDKWRFLVDRPIF